MRIGAVGAADLLDDEAVGAVVEAGAAVLARDDRAEVALVGDLGRRDRGRSGCCARSSRAPGDDLVVGEVARRSRGSSCCSSVRAKSMPGRYPATASSPRRLGVDPFAVIILGGVGGLVIGSAAARAASTPAPAPTSAGLEADAFGRARGPERDRRPRPDARGRQPPAPRARRAGADRGARCVTTSRRDSRTTTSAATTTSPSSRSSQMLEAKNERRARQGAAGLITRGVPREDSRTRREGPAGGRWAAAAWTLARRARRRRARGAARHAATERPRRDRGRRRRVLDRRPRPHRDAALRAGQRDDPDVAARDGDRRRRRAGRGAARLAAAR